MYQTTPLPRPQPGWVAARRPRLIAVLLAAALLGGAGCQAGRQGADPPTPPASPRTTGSPGGPIDVTAYGAAGNGVTDDTLALQGAINAAPDGAVVYFPRGTYLTQTLIIESRKSLTLQGEGPRSLIRRMETDMDIIAKITGSEDITIRDLGFDANGVPAFGGVQFRACKRILIAGNRFFDSAPQPVGEFDRYAVIFLSSPGRVYSEDIRIVDNEIRNLQLEVDHARRVEIIRNRSENAVKTTAIGAFSLTDRAVAEDYLIKDNVVIDPAQYAFTLLVDPPDKDDNLFRRITIKGNTIIRRSTGGQNFRIGTGSTSESSVGNVFEDIAIVNNRVIVDDAATAQLSSVFASASTDFFFERLTVKGNVFRLAGKLAPGFSVLDLRRLSNSVIVRNLVVDADDRAISFREDLGGNVVRGNRVKP